jgi:hypothetical protein
MTGGAHGGVVAAANCRAHHARGERGGGWAAKWAQSGGGGRQARPPSRLGRTGGGGAGRTRGEAGWAAVRSRPKGGEVGIFLFQFLIIIYSISNLLLSANFMETKRIHPKVN